MSRHRFDRVPVVRGRQGGGHHLAPRHHEDPGAVDAGRSRTGARRGRPRGHPSQRATAHARPAAGRRALRRGEGERVRARRRARCQGGPGGRLHLARRGRRGRGRRAARRRSRGRPGPDLRRAHRRRAAARRSGRRRCRRVVGAVPCRGAAPRRPRPRQVRLGHGTPRRQGGRGPRALRRRRPGWSARRADEPFRDCRRGRHHVLRVPAGTLHGVGPRAQARPSRAALPHREQRGDAARAAHPLRHGPQRHRHVRAGAVQRRPVQGRSAPGHEAQLVRRRGAPGGARGVGGLRPAVHSGRAGPRGHRAHRLRGRHRAPAHQPRPGAGRRSALRDPRHDQHGPADGAPAGRLGRGGRRGRVLRRRRTRRWRAGGGGRGGRDGTPGAPRILCEEMAQLLETINYEIVCDVSPRVVRRYRAAGPAA